MNFLLVTFALFAVAGSALSARPSTPGLSECQEHAARERRLESQLNLIPKCKPDGTYEELQCYGQAVQGGQFCSCWDPTGQPLSSPSRKTKACACERQRKSVQGPNGRAPLGAYVPQCEADGTYKKQQGHGSTGMQWCADPLTGEVKGKKAAPGENIRLSCN